jgi:ABC-type antimicrobial peptide transport system permease subunit
MTGVGTTNWRLLFRYVWRTLGRSRLRALLTVLGMSVGVGSLIVVQALGAGAQQQMALQFQSLGANLLAVQAGGAIRAGNQWKPAQITEADAAALEAEIPSIQAVAPVVRGTAQLVGNKTSWSSPVLAVTPAYFAVREWPTAQGTVFNQTHIEQRARVVVLGAGVARELYGPRSRHPIANPVGQTIKINEMPAVVMGVLQAKGRSPMGQDQDEVIVLPLSTYRLRIPGHPQLGVAGVSSFTVKVRDGLATVPTEQAIDRVMRSRWRVDVQERTPLQVNDFKEIQKARERSGNILTLVMGSIAVVSLIAGGIGIMNMLLLSVVQRTREIGILLALGAKRRFIRQLFLGEALALSIVGGVLGIAIAVAALALIAYSVGWPMAVQWQSIGMALGFSLSTGLVFGWLPAHRAAQLQPLEALRHV